MNMKFEPFVNEKSIVIPKTALKLSSMDDAEKLEFRISKNAIVLLKRPMTAKELIEAADSLHQLSVHLAVCLAQSCGPCTGCETDCPLPPNASEDDEHDCPDNAAVDTKRNTVIIKNVKYQNEIDIVPMYMLEMFDAAGICLGELNEHIVKGDYVYGK